MFLNSYQVRSQVYRLDSRQVLQGKFYIQIRGASFYWQRVVSTFIVDGLPIDNGAFNPDRTNGIVDVGNRAGDISSDDIESINVLKGAAATALYGARAKDVLS